MKDDKPNVIVELTFDFSINIIEFVEELRNARKFEMASQIFESGTSIGANVKEAQNSESTAGFIHKLNIAAKEADETQYWLELCEKSPLLPLPKSELKEELITIIKIISKIISSVKKG